MVKSKKAATVSLKNKVPASTEEFFFTRICLMLISRLLPQDLSRFSLATISLTRVSLATVSLAWVKTAL